MDEIDKVLTQEPVIEPSTDFTRRVMTAVREQATVPEPIEFPWHRFLPGLCTSLALTLATFMVLGWTTGAETLAPDPEALARALDSALIRGLAIAVATVGGSLLVAWLALRPGRRRTSSF